jgi:hypothetical protein
VYLTSSVLTALISPRVFWLLDILRPLLEQAQEREP